METTPPGAPRPRPLRRRRKLTFASAVLLLGVAAWYGGWVVVRGHRFYVFVTTRQRATSDGLWRRDGALGYVNVPGSRGELVFPVGPNLPVRFDRSGFRIPVGAATDDATAGPRPFVLGLGCSFTFGDGCLAEDTFLERVARGIHGTALNAGTCSYGLAQVLLRARERVPRHRPEVVLVQYSPWLVERAGSPYAETVHGTIPQPYFADTGNGLELHSPVFEPILFDLPVDRFRSGTRSLAEELRFLGAVALPLYVHDDLNRASVRARGIAGGVAPGAGDRARIVAAVYAEIAMLCRASGSRLLVVIVGGHPPSAAEKAALEGAGVVLVDGQQALYGRLPVVSLDAYYRAYAHWRDGRLVDAHPNPVAHEILAGAILSVHASGRR